MDNRKSDLSPEDLSWDRYWLGMTGGAGFGVGGASHHLLDKFWRDFFTSLKTERRPIVILDIASGDGAILATAIDLMGQESFEATCLDISQHAVEMVQNRFPAVAGIVASALQVPRESASFDIVTSQFGLEYAGAAAFPEAARLVAPGGRLALLAHNRDSAIYRECSASIDAVEKLRACEFIARSITLFKTGFATLQGADRSLYDRAFEDLLPAYRELGSIMQRFGEHVAGDTLLRLYEDVDNIHQQMERYEPTEILEWLTKLDSELDTYVRIMNSMRDAALSEAQFIAVCDTLKNAGLELKQAVPLYADDLKSPIAWALTAHSRAKRAI